MMSAEQDRLDSVYRLTTFWAELPEVAVALRIGERSEVLDRTLRERHVWSWAFVTAYNPGSKPVAPPENRRLQGLLLQRLRELRWPYVPGVGVGHASEWPPEESVLVLGITPAEALALGREFGQNAVVVGRVGQAPQLRWCNEA
jgi:hypothetical protein